MSDLRDKGKNQIYSKRIKAGNKRTYYIDVRMTKNEDYYLTITESKKNFGRDDLPPVLKQKLFLYKEDFNKFIDALDETILFVKEKLMPDYDFDKFNHDYETIESMDIEDHIEDGKKTSSDDETESAATWSAKEDTSSNESTEDDDVWQDHGKKSGL